MKKPMQSLVITLFLAVLSACSNNVTVAPTPVPDTAYILGAGDQIRLIVYGHEDFSGEFVVDSTGSISLPLVTEIKASGLTVRALEKKITNALQPKYLKDPKVSIELITMRDIYILGEVRTPGKYPYIPNMTVQQAVAVAGGYTYRGNEGEAEVTRQTADALVTMKIPAKNIIQPGDTVVIKRRWF